MRRLSAVALAGVLLLARPSSALEVVVTLLQVDPEGATLRVKAGMGRTVQVAKDAQFLDSDGKPLPDELKSKELKEGAVVTLTIEPGDGGPEVRTLRLGGQAPAKGGRPAQQPRPSTGLKPLTEMTADDRYQGEDGGLYGRGKNEPTGELAAAAKRETAKVRPLDKDGRPDADGIIGLVSISMSNATQEFSLFKQLADADPAKSPLIKVVDCAQGGQAMAQWATPDARPWAEAARRLERAGVSPNQVQVAWVKLANVGPTGVLGVHGKKLATDTRAVVQIAKAKFPNLRVVYLGSRIYGGYANTPLNPEPYAYEGAFVCRWLIRDQAQGDADLNFDPARGAAKAPLLLWGPYLWADGTTPRKSDGLVWERKDLTDRDGTHPTDSGRRKVAELLLTFFKTDPYASTWFVKK
jgi:hypothetical protein